MTQIGLQDEERRKEVCFLDDMVFLYCVQRAPCCALLATAELHSRDNWKLKRKPFSNDAAFSPGLSKSDEKFGEIKLAKNFIWFLFSSRGVEKQTEIELQNERGLSICWFLRLLFLNRCRRIQSCDLDGFWLERGISPQSRFLCAAPSQWTPRKKMRTSIRNARRSRQDNLETYKQKTHNHREFVSRKKIIEEKLQFKLLEF